MAAGYNLDSSCDIGYCDDILIGPGAVVTVTCTWDFKDNQWLRLSFVPSGYGRVSVLSEWTERRLVHYRHYQVEEVSLGARVRNDSGEAVSVQPVVLVAPPRR